MPKPLALLAAAVLLFAASPARADMLVDGSEAVAPKVEPDPRPERCAAYEVHARYLATHWGESPFFTGASDDGIALQLFVNRATGSWTALVVRRDGFSCVTGMGEKGRPEVGL
jgi:hypothetical protein